MKSKDPSCSCCYRSITASISAEHLDYHTVRFEISILTSVDYLAHMQFKDNGPKYAEPSFKIDI